MRSSGPFAALLAIAISASHLLEATMTQEAGWLDRPLAGWNVSGAGLPRSGSTPEQRDAIASRCKIDPHGSTPGDRALAAAGWIPMPHLARVLEQGDVQIVDGVIALNAACEPSRFNTFVFVGGRFAGTLSPAPMNARTDGGAGAIRMPTPDTITVDFSRYASTDPDCCPSSHVIVQFSIDRSQTPAVVVPLKLRTRS